MPEIRIYKRFDADIMALHAAGYPVQEMIKMAVCAYANGSPIHFVIPEQLLFDSNNRVSFRFSFRVPSSDVNTKNLLNTIKHGHINTFCKLVLRDALVFQNLNAFYSSDKFLHLTSDRMEELFSEERLRRYGNEKVYLLNKDVASKRRESAQIKMGDSTIFTKNANRRRRTVVSKDEFILLSPKNNEAPQIHSITPPKDSTDALFKPVQDNRNELTAPHINMENNETDSSTSAQLNINIPLEASHIPKKDIAQEKTISVVPPLQNKSTLDNDSTSADDLMAAFEAMMD